MLQSSEVTGRPYFDGAEIIAASSFGDPKFWPKSVNECIVSVVLC